MLRGSLRHTEQFSYDVLSFVPLPAVLSAAAEVDVEAEVEDEVVFAVAFTLSAAAFRARNSRRPSSSARDREALSESCRMLSAASVTRKVRLSTRRINLKVRSEGGSLAEVALSRFSDATRRCLRVCSVATGLVVEPRASPRLSISNSAAALFPFNPASLLSPGPKVVHVHFALTAVQACGRGAPHEGAGNDYAGRDKVPRDGHAHDDEGRG